MELGPQFPKIDSGKHANGYSAGKDINSAIGQNKKPPYQPKHAAGNPVPVAEKAAVTKPVAPARTPEKASVRTPVSDKPVNKQQTSPPHRFYHHHGHGMTENMHALVGFQGDNGRTVA